MWRLLVVGMFVASGALGSGEPHGFADPSLHRAEEPSSVARGKNDSTGLTIGCYCSWEHAAGSSYVTMGVDQVTNSRNGGLSGTLRLELWATTSIPVFGDTISSYTLGTSDSLGQLQGGYHFNAFTVSPAYHAPPDGTYWITIALLEYDNGYKYVDLMTFSTTSTFGTGNGVVSMVGYRSWEHLAGASYVTLSVESIRNDRTGGVSGTLKLELWATATPPVPGQTISPYVLGAYTLGELQGGYRWDNVVAYPAYTPPPDGTYWITMALLEYQGDRFAYVDFSTFPNPATFGSGGCEAAGALCLNARFRVTASWTTRDGAVGVGTPVLITGETGYFWFFDPSNVEMVVKVLDARAVNGAFWVFAAGLTNVHVDLDVLDTLTGATRRYENPQGAAFIPIQDTVAFAGLATPDPRNEDLAALVSEASSEVFAALGERLGDARVRHPEKSDRRAAAVTSGCIEDGSQLCLNGGRFRVATTWTRRDGSSGEGRATSLTGDTGYFWFFDPSNVEVVVKVLEACGVNGQQWVFAAGLTNVAVRIVITDTWTGAVREYSNPQGAAFRPIQDTAAFACGG
jgi:hypothetical protein